jgi:putative cell wall-binding protein
LHTSYTPTTATTRTTTPAHAGARRFGRALAALAAAGALTLLAAPLTAAAAEAPEPVPVGTEATTPLSAARNGDEAALLDDDGGYYWYRYGGASRYEVAANVTRGNFDAGIPVLYIASGEKYPDALSAGPAAAKEGGALLLVTPDAVPAATRDAIVALQPQKLVVVGGTATVSDTVYSQLAGLQPNIIRIAGADRYEVSRNIIDYAFCGIAPGASSDVAACPGGGLANVFVATGNNFPDALASGPAASFQNGGVLLVPGSNPSLDSATHALLTRAGVTKASISGGPNSVSDGIQGDLSASLATVRYSGADRFEVAANINAGVFPVGTSIVFIASGGVFPDALSAGPVAASYDAPLFLVRSYCYPTPTADAIWESGRYNLEDLVIMGGQNTINADFETGGHYCE